MALCDLCDNSEGPGTNKNSQSLQGGGRNEDKRKENEVGATTKKTKPCSVDPCPIDLEAQSVSDTESCGSDIEFISETAAQDVELHIVSCRNPKRRRYALAPIEDSRVSDGNSTFSSCTDENVEDVRVVGEQTVLNSKTFYSHFRFMCSATEPCPKCFCFVCDISVSQCKEWIYHKHALDSNLWRLKRKQRMEREKQRKMISVTPSFHAMRGRSLR